MNRDRLVVLGSSITALAIARNARALSLAPVVIDTERGIATLSSGCTVQIVTAQEDARCRERILALGGARASLIATSDYWVQFVADNHEDLRATYANVWHPKPDVLRTCLSKVRFAEWCRESHVPAPAFATAEKIHGSDLAELSFPMILRPVQTLHHLSAPPVPKAVAVHDADALDEWLATYRQHGLDPFLSQSLLHRPLTQYSVGVARRGTQILSLLSKKLRPHPEQCRVGTCVSTCSNPDVETLGRDVAERLDFQGIAEVEILLAHDTGESFVVEVNPRPWLQYSLTRAAGRDFLRFLLEGGDAETGAGDASGHCWLNFRADLYNCFSRSEGLVRNRRIGPGEYLRSLIRSDAHACFSVRDPRPAWSELKATAMMLAPKRTASPR